MKTLYATRLFTGPLAWSHHMGFECDTHYYYHTKKKYSYKQRSARRQVKWLKGFNEPVRYRWF